VLLPDEEAALWAALADGPSYLLPCARVALWTGMREEEFLGLRRADVDFRRDILFVGEPQWCVRWPASTRTRRRRCSPERTGECRMCLLQAVDGATVISIFPESEIRV